MASCDQLSPVWSVGVSGRSIGSLLIGFLSLVTSCLECWRLFGLYVIIRLLSVMVTGGFGEAVIDPSAVDNVRFGYWT